MPPSHSGTFQIEVMAVAYFEFRRRPLLAATSMQAVQIHNTLPSRSIQPLR